MATRGRPAFQPTDDQRKNVEVMASLGIPEENIRLVVRNRSDTPISRTSLRKHFKKELEIGATKLNARVGHFMVATIFGTRPPDGVTPIRDERSLITRPLRHVQLPSWSPIRVRRMDDNLNDPVTIEAIRTIEL